MNKYNTSVSTYLSAAVRMHPDPVPDTAPAADLIRAHVRLVARIAAQNARNEEEFEENVGVGNLALVLSTRNYDPAKGPFTTWASYYILGEIRQQRRDGLGARNPRHGADRLPSRTRPLPQDTCEDASAAPSDGDLEVYRALSTGGDSQYDAVLSAQLSAAIDTALTTSQRRALRGRLEDKSLEEVAAAHGVSQQSIRAAELRAVSVLQGVLHD